MTRRAWAVYVALEVIGLLLVVLWAWRIVGLFVRIM